MGWDSPLRLISDHQMGETKKGPSERPSNHQVLVKGCTSPTNGMSVYVCSQRISTNVYRMVILHVCVIFPVPLNYSV